MSKPKREKLTATVTPEKTRPEKPLVELSKDQLEAIAGGRGSYSNPAPPPGTDPDPDG